MEVEQVVNDRIHQFKADLCGKSVSRIVRRHITFGNCYVFNEDKYFELKLEISDHFNIHPSEVLLVGSGKLGFSIAPQKRYRPFGDSSDIDIAIISPYLFDKVWQDVFEYNDRNIFPPCSKDFKDYLFKGWIRPDKLPTSNSFSLKKEWFEFFRTLTQTGKYSSYKIAAGLYKNWYFLEGYQSCTVKACKQELEYLL